MTQRDGSTRVWSSSRCLCVLAVIPFYATASRSWTSIELLHSIEPTDGLSASTFESDPYLESSATDYPIQSPIVYSSPTIGTGPLPTRIPFDSGYTPAPSPDPDPYPVNPTPANPPRGYFNYDDQDSALYGPGYLALVRGDNGFSIAYHNNGWANVQNPVGNAFYWNEFSNDYGFGAWAGSLGEHDFEQNQCANVGMQSPIDIRLSGVACVEHHQIRSLPGDYSVSGSKVEKRIESNKLRLVFQRRPCADLLNTLCAEPDPPFADFPNGWGGFADAMHVDFKVPSEHWIYGQKFDAEMQIYHVHADRQRIPAVSVLMRVDADGYNSYLQSAIDAFQTESDLHRAQCGANIRKQRSLVSDFHTSIMGDVTVDPLMTDYESWADYSTMLEDPDYEAKKGQHERSLAGGVWSPYHTDLISTYWFYGYDGSLTEPPCTEIVSWFVMDTPMRISQEQLDQMKMILFNHVDSDCKATSVHFNGSVARPIQETAGRQVWQCTPDDFAPDS